MRRIALENVKIAVTKKVTVLIFDVFCTLLFQTPCVTTSNQPATAKTEACPQRLTL